MRKKLSNIYAISVPHQKAPNLMQLLNMFFRHVLHGNRTTVYHERPDIVRKLQAMKTHEKHWMIISDYWPNLLVYGFEKSDAYLLWPSKTTEISIDL